MFILIIILLLVMVGLSVRWNWWRLPQGGVPILMYHKIGDPPSVSKIKKLWVSKKKFRKQLTYLKNKGYQSLTFADIVKGKKPDKQSVIITFDDGYQNNYTCALPLLNEFGFKAVFFVTVDAVGKDNYWHNPATEQRIPMMTKEQLRELSREGHEVGSHTLAHPDLTNMAMDTLQKEITLSREKLKEIIGKEIASFSYPYGSGAFDGRINGIVKQAGYSYACSIRQGKAEFKTNVLSLKRLLIRGDDTWVDFYLNITRGKSRS